MHAIRMNLYLFVSKIKLNDINDVISLFPEINFSDYHVTFIVVSDGSNIDSNRMYELNHDYNKV